MKIAEVIIKNFLTIGDKVELDLDNKGLVLIVGDNRDDSSAISNGAGKSTIGDAIFWCLYGVTARGESGDAVVNNIVGKDCLVEVIIQDDAHTYSITRYRKHKTHKNSLVVNNLSNSTCLTKGTDKLTQELVTKIIGCSVDVFKSAIYAAQDSIPNLPGMTDKNLKEIVEEAAGINRLGEAYVIAREELKIKENSLVAATTNLSIIVDSETALTIDLADLTVKESGFEGSRVVKITALAGKMTLLQNFRSDRQSDIGLIDEDDLLERLAATQKELDDFITIKAVADDAEKLTSKELAKAEALLRSAAHKVKSDAAKLESIQDRIGKPCDECGKEYCEEDLESAAQIAKDNMSKTKREALTFKNAWNEAKYAQNIALTEQKSLGNITAAVAKTKAVSDEIREELSGLDTLRSLCKSTQKDIDALKKEIDELSIAKSPYTEMIDTLNVKLGKLSKDKTVYQDKITKCSTARDLAKDAVKVFSPAGVRAHVIDTVTPQLNDRTSHYLSALSDGNISATWNTLSKTKTGELREKFIIEVSNDKGASSFGGLSGGEKRKVRLATSLALQDLVASRASKPFNLYIADEVDDALDEGGLERLMMLLEEKSREKGTVLMISHNSLGDWCNEQATVIKEGGFSRVEGVLSV